MPNEVPQDVMRVAREHDLKGTDGGHATYVDFAGITRAKHAEISKGPE